MVKIFRNLIKRFLLIIFAVITYSSITAFAENIGDVHFTNIPESGEVTLSGNGEQYKNKEITIRAVKYNKQPSIENVVYLKQITADENGNFSQTFNLGTTGAYHILVKTSDMKEAVTALSQDNRYVSLAVYEPKEKSSEIVRTVASKLNNSNIF